MLDYLGEQAADPRAAEAGRLIEDAVEGAFAVGRLRPMEFGGDMGTVAIARELVEFIGTAA